AELSAFGNRTGRLRGNLARKTAGERGLGAGTLHTFFMGSNVRRDLAVRPLEVSVCDQTGTAVPGAGGVDHVEGVRCEQSVQGNIDEVKARCCHAVAKKPGLDMFLCERLLK